MWAVLRPDGVELHAEQVPGSVPADDRRPALQGDEEWTDQQIIVAADRKSVVVVAPKERMSERKRNTRTVREHLMRFLDAKHPSEEEKTAALKAVIRLALNQLDDISDTEVDGDPTPSKPDGDDGDDDDKKPVQAKDHKDD